MIIVLFLPNFLSKEEPITVSGIERFKRETENFKFLKPWHVKISNSSNEYLRELNFTS